jgi:hypothetical protein
MKESTKIDLSSKKKVLKIDIKLNNDDIKILLQNMKKYENIEVINLESNFIFLLKDTEIEINQIIEIIKNVNACTKEIILKGI